MAMKERHTCVFAGCDREAVHHLGVRLRNYPGPNNTWTQDTGAWLCNEHASVGVRLRIEMDLHPNPRKLSTTVSAGGPAVENETDLNPQKLPPKT